LDQTYTALIRHRLDPAEIKYPSPLLNWRRKVCEAFAGALADQHRWHPAEVPLKIIAAIHAGRLSLPESIILAAFEAPAPIEADLFRLLDQTAPVMFCPLPMKKPANLHAVTLPDQEQEILYLAQALLHSCQQFDPGTIGVVVPNLDAYAPTMRKTLKALLGQPATSQEETFNVTLGSPLVEQPLVQAALLPLRLLGEEEKRPVLISLILSPYYLIWTKNRYQLARLDRQWREMSPEADLDSLYVTAQNREPDLTPYLSPGGTDLRDLLAPFRRNRSRSAAEWKALLERLWDALKFPALADEADRIAHNHLKSTLTRLAADLGSWTLDSLTFLAWLRQALAAEIFQVSGSEQAGVQVMGLIESRGLAFQRLFLLGMTSTALPQPVRPLPFLELEERRQILGGTIESQYDFARAAFHHLMAAAPEIILTKPEEVDGEPISPTPFWPTPWQPTNINLWDNPDPAWSRVHWFRSCWRGLQEPHQQEAVAERLTTPIQFPESISVSSLAVAFHCPFRFLIEELLDLKPLADPIAGLRPEERGQRLHKVLACITSRLRFCQQLEDLGWQRAFPVVQECVDEAHANVVAASPWQVERRRWLGNEWGLLRQWLHQERHHFEAGWRWLAEELSFKGLIFEGWPTSISGRIDRLDLHPEAGLFCWDYKSGSSPSPSEVFSQMSEPQLPAYLFALLQGRLEIPERHRFQAYPLQAGYITLKSEKNVRLDRLQADADQWQHFLPLWQKRLAELGRRLQQGDFSPDPVPTAPERRRERLCTYCGLLTVCNRKDFEKR
jgi:RecB family exonuclease